MPPTLRNAMYGGHEAGDEGRAVERRRSGRRQAPPSGGGLGEMKGTKSGEYIPHTMAGEISATLGFINV